VSGVRRFVGGAVSRILGPALGLHVLGWGSAARGWTLDGPMSLGGTWGWKSAEALGFLLGETPAVRWGAFGGAWLASLLLGLGLDRWPRAMRWVATALLGADLAVCAAVGDPANVGIHALGLTLLWIRRPGCDHSEAVPGTTASGGP
jgi:hypothetical protein